MVYNLLEKAGHCMEAIATLATAITTLIFSEAFKEGGKVLGKGAAEKMGELVTTIRQKFKASGTEVLLTRAEKQPTESNIATVKAELITQMNEDNDWVRHLENLQKQLEAIGVTRQVMLTGITADSLEFTGDMSQKSNQRGTQIMASDLKINGDVKLSGNFKQEG
jgi:ubiquinone biosynthesis protein UbiJ